MVFAGVGFDVVYCVAFRVLPGSLVGHDQIGVVDAKQNLVKSVYWKQEQKYPDDKQDHKPEYYPSIDSSIPVFKDRPYLEMTSRLHI